MTMRQRIAKHEQTLRNPTLGFLSAVSARVRLFLTYIQYAFVHSFTLLFLHPTKSFVALNDPASNGLWRRSYIDHLAYRNQVRFASLSGFFVLLTASIATFAIVITVFPDSGFSPVYAASITVNSNNDVNDGSCDVVHCSLREAITQANSAAGSDLITFSGAPYIIQLSSALPFLSADATIIQGGGKVTIDGSAAGSGVHGFNIQGDTVGIQGMIVHSFTGSGISVGANADTALIGGVNTGEGNVLYSNGQNGIAISGGTGSKVSGNKIGQKADGSLAKNSLQGILAMAGSPSIGDTESTNYVIDGITVGQNADGVTLYGNVVGESSSGLTGSLTLEGVEISGKNTVLGGTATGQRNYIVAGGSNGVLVDGTATNTSITGNYIGLSPSGTVKSNTGHGIKSSKTKGGLTVSSNVVVGSKKAGIYFEEVDTGTSSISDNTVGLLPSGGAAGNVSGGITILNSSSLTISGNISGYNSNGIDLTDTTATVTGNYVGIDKVGNAAVNSEDGIFIGGSSAGTVVGGSAANRNYVSNNLENGIAVSSGATGTPTISYNYVGVSLDGNSAAANQTGIKLEATASVSNNLVSGNTFNGIDVYASSCSIILNTVGLNAVGDAAVSNGTNGIYIASDVSSNAIGESGKGNVIAGNNAAGILIDSGATGTQVIDNYLNCGAGCTTKVGAEFPGLVISGAISTTVQGNYIGGNTDAAMSSGSGVDLNSGATGTEITSNFIGQGTDGSDISDGGLIGILVSSSDTQTIGTVDAGNTIANFGVGIQVDASNKVSIRGNIFSNNTTDDVIFLNEANAGIESPVITELTADGAAGTSAVSGSIDLYEDGVYMASGESDGTWSIAVALDVNKVIAATITDSEGNTSDFGAYTPPEPDEDTTTPVSTASPAGGTYSGTQSVTLSATDDTDAAPKIYFTLDGSTPTTDSTLYSSAISIALDATLKFFAVDSSDNAEAVNAEAYNIKQDKGGVISTDNITVKTDGEAIHPECDSCVVRIEDTTPTFLGIVSQSFIDYIVRLVIFVSTQKADGTTDLEKVFADTDTIIQNPKNTENAIWKITVSEDQALDLGEYVVKVGLRDPDGAVVKPMGKKVSLAVTPPNPVIVSPQALVYTKTPTFIGNALNDTRVIARVFQDGAEVGHCQADVVNGEAGTGSYACALPFELKTGQYTARVNTQDLASELISSGSEVAFSISRPTPVLDNVPFSLVPSEISIQSQYLTTDNTPVFVGLATNDTEVVLVIDGTELFSATLTNDDSGVGHWETTTSFLAERVHTAYAVVRLDGEEINRTDTVQFKIVAPTVVPTIGTTEGSLRFAQGQEVSFTLLGHSGDTVELSLTGPADITVSSIFSTDPSGTGETSFTFTNGLTRGDWVATAIATDSTGKPSLESAPVSVSIFVPIVATPTTPTEPIEEPTEEPTNTNETPVNTNEEPTNTNGEPTTNTNEAPVNTNEQPTTNTNETPTNTNEVPVGNVNATPSETPAEREPLPEPPPAFTFPEGVENFPIIDKTPEDLTSEEVQAVRIVLNTYLQSELQILPVEQEGNALYLITETTADNEPILTVAQEVGLDTSSALTNTLNNALRVFGFSQLKQTESLLIFRGTTVPYATVQLTIFSDPIVKIAQADADGRWTMTVAADTLPPGDHSAYVQTSYGGATSEEVQIARFVVVQQERLSNTTWLFIINLGVILIVLLAAIFLQLRKRTQLLEIKQAAIPAESPWKSGSVKMPTQEDKTKKPKGPDDLGDIMGI